MKHTILLLILLLSVFSLTAQTIKIGGKAPDFKKGFVWLTEPVGKPDKPTVVEYFSSENALCRDRLDTVASEAEQLEGSVNVVVVVRDDDIQGQMMLARSDRKYKVVQCTPQKLRAMWIFYVPYAYIYDKKHRVTWNGNSIYLTPEILTQYTSDGILKNRSLRKATSR